jgi:hypothetical protein
MTTESTLFDGHADDEGSIKDARLSSQLVRTFEVMNTYRTGGEGDHAFGYWYTLQELAVKVNASEASVSARIRDLRKDRFGGWTINKVQWKTGLYVYGLDQDAGGIRALVYDPLPIGSTAHATMAAKVRSCEEVYVDGVEHVRYLGDNHYMAASLLDALNQDIL